MSKKKKGFTLVELIVVIGILLALAVLATVGYGSLADQAKRAALRSDAVTVAKALNTFNSIVYSTTDRITSESTGAYLTFKGASANVAAPPNTQGILNLCVSTSEDMPASPTGTKGTVTNPFLGVTTLEGSVVVDAKQANLLAYASTRWIVFNATTNTWDVQEGSLNY
jgi:prepilin-type N-terminal cleavage/methylation domain-containing protein